MLVVSIFLTVSTLFFFFFMSTKKVIINELICPCVEHMSQWHEEKSQKYYPLCSSVRSNGWSVYFYAVEVDAWGFSAEPVKNCLHSLGFNNKLCRKTLQVLSCVAKNVLLKFSCTKIQRRGSRQPNRSVLLGIDSEKVQRKWSICP